MLDTRELQAGNRCLYQSLELFYQRTVVGDDIPTYHEFTTQRGTIKRLSEVAAMKYLWLEIKPE